MARPTKAEVSDALIELYLHTLGRLTDASAVPPDVRERVEKVVGRLMKQAGLNDMTELGYAERRAAAAVSGAANGQGQYSADPK